MTIAHHPHSYVLPAQFQEMAMDAAEDAGRERERELGWVWFLIPALWLGIGIAGYLALSNWPQLFA